MFFSNIQAIGLAYDGFGILVIGVPIIRRSRNTIFTIGGSFFGYNKALMRDLFETRIDLFSGTCLLFIGFMLQFVGALHSEPISEALGACIVALGVLLCLAVRWQRGKLIDRWLRAHSVWFERRKEEKERGRQRAGASTCESERR